MKKNILKRILTTVLAVSMVLPGSSLTARAETGSPDNLVEDYATQRAMTLAQKNQKEGIELPEVETVDPNELVRVIIEFKTTPNQISQSRDGVSTLARIDREQETFFKQVNQSGIKFEKLNTFRNVLNGTSAMIKRKDIDLVKEMNGVVEVSIAEEFERPEPLMTDSVNTIHAPYAWDLDYNGEGLVVGIIDSGFDVSHKDFNLTNPEKAKLTKDSFAIKNLDGRYLNAKFPYGYNYYDQNHIINEGGMSHGQHVAGTVAANGSIKGVAPEAQLLALRVFSNDPIMSTTFTDIYIKAIDDGVTLGADALNLSLGAPAAFTSWTETPLDRAVANARNSGVLVAIAAGNDRNAVNGHKDDRHTEDGSRKPRTAASWMPDQGIMSTPALTRESLAVAASEKVPHVWDEIFLSINRGNRIEKRDILPAALSPNPVEVLGGQELEYVSVVYGYKEDYAKVDVKGKVALVMRGEIPFTDKLANAEAAGAAAILVYDNQWGELVNMAGGEDATIPYVFTDISTGQLLENLPEGERKIKFDGVKAENPGTMMTDFSTWGSTNDLRLKPEITAPGADINSLQNNNGYGIMSGTSMATPHVAGGAVVVKGYLNDNETFKNLSELQKISAAKIIMMNTAEILYEGGAARSPRVQGAGLMNLENVIKAKTMVTNPKTKEAKIELKEVAKPSFGLNLNVHNFGDETQTYETEVILLTDSINDYGDYTELSRNVEFTLTGDDKLTVEPGQDKPLNLFVDFSKDPIEKEQFIEGFVVLTDQNGLKSSVPFMGFYGDWSKPLMLDNFISNEEVGQDPYGVPYFQMSALLGTYMMELAPGFEFPSYILHQNVDLALNPGEPITKVTGTGDITPHLTFLRSLETFKFSILDENKENIFNIGSMTNVTKVNSLYRGASSVRTIGQGIWKGDTRDGRIPEGKYFYEMRGRINYENAKDQVKLVPFIIDYSAPLVQNVRVEDNFLYFDATDGPEDRSSGVQEFIVSNSKEESEADILVAAREDNEYKVDISSLMADDVSEVYIFSFDKIYNSAMTTVAVQDPPAEQYLPTIIMVNPNQISETTDVVVQGYVIGVEALDEIQLITEDETISYEAEFVEHEVIPDPSQPWEVLYEGPAWIIDTVVSMNTGYKSLKVVARAKDGTENSLVRWLYVDDGAPILDIEVMDRETDSATATFAIKMQDSLPTLRLLMNKEEIFNFDGLNDKVEAITREIEQEVELKVGENKFNFTLIDALGNVTEETVIVTRSETAESAHRIEGANRYLTSIEVSRKAFKNSDWVIIVSGESATDSLLAGPLSVRLQAPILLTKKDGLTNELVNEIKRLGASNAMIVGGKLPIPEEIAKDLEALGLNTERLGGKDRFETSVLVDAKVREISRVYDKAVIANAYTVFDALSMGSSAGKMGVGILLNDGKSISHIESALSNVDSVVLLGGKLVEAKSVEDMLENKNIKVERIYGATRYETAAAIANRFYDNPSTVILSNGVKPYDALSGTSLATKYDAPLLLTSADMLNETTRDYLVANSPKTAYILGGELAIKESVKVEVENLLK